MYKHTIGLLKIDVHKQIVTPAKMSTDVMRSVNDDKAMVQSQLDY